jgi:hypothetical protein
VANDSNGHVSMSGLVFKAVVAPLLVAGALAGAGLGYTLQSTDAVHDGKLQVHEERLDGHDRYFDRIDAKLDKILDRVGGP